MDRPQRSLILTLAVSLALIIGASSAPAEAAHLFLAVTIDDLATVGSICDSQKTMEQTTPGIVTPHATTDLHISLVEFDVDSLTKQQTTDLNKSMTRVVNDLDTSYGKIKLADEIKGATFKIFTKGFVVFQLDSQNFAVLKDIADRSRQAVVKANIPIAKSTQGTERNDFDSKHPNPHISFGTFDSGNAEELKKTFVAFSGVKGATVIGPPNATDRLGLHEIDLKQNQGGHYANVQSWVLPSGGNPHITPKPCP